VPGLNVAGLLVCTLGRKVWQTLPFARHCQAPLRFRGLCEASRVFVAFASRVVAVPFCAGFASRRNLDFRRVVRGLRTTQVRRETSDSAQWVFLRGLSLAATLFWTAES
jgi:hypothetical protein